MSERPLLNKPKFIKVIDLERLGSGYNVIVQIIETNEKVVETR